MLKVTISSHMIQVTDTARVRSDYGRVNTYDKAINFDIAQQVTVTASTSSDNV
jgi:hypothetical protein